MEGLYVLWNEDFTPTGIQESWMDDPNFNPNDFRTEHKGQVIGTVRSFWRGTLLVVACEDDKVREVEIDKVTLIQKS